MALFEVRSMYVKNSDNQQLEDKTTRYSGSVAALNKKIAELMAAGHPDFPTTPSHMVAMHIYLVDDFVPIT